MALPFIKFFPTDYVADTRTLSTHAKGCYMDLLCMLHDNQGKAEKSIDVLARFFGCSKAAAKRAINELEEERVLEVNYNAQTGKYELEQRRMIREEEEREYERTKKRKQRQGEDIGSEEETTADNEFEGYKEERQDRDNKGDIDRDSTGDKGGTIPEARDQKPESPLPPKNPKLGGGEFSKITWEAFCKHFKIINVPYLKVKNLPDKILAQLLAVNKEKQKGQNIRDVLAVARTRQVEPHRENIQSVIAWLHPPPLGTPKREKGDVTFFDSFSQTHICYCSGNLIQNYANGTGDTTYICQSCGQVYYKR